MFFNITGIAVLQYAVGMFLTVYVLNHFYSLNPGFGLMMATGYYGGHGTAAAVGQAYEALGWSEATDLAYTTATVGIVGGIILGIIIINWGARKNYTNYVRSPKALPVSMKTGLIPKAEQSTARLELSQLFVPIQWHSSGACSGSIHTGICIVKIPCTNYRRRNTSILYCTVIWFYHEFLPEQNGWG